MDMGEEIKKAVAESMRKARSLPRKHANFFNWHDKETKELAICSEFVQFLINEHGESFDSIDLGDDPPDCVAKFEENEVAIEIVELVDQNAIEVQIRLNKEYSSQEPWTTARMMKHLNKLIQQKDNPSEKQQLKKVYSRYIVLIHTDEPELMVGDFDRLFKKGAIQSTELVNEAYLLFSYDSAIKGYPLRKLI